MIGFLSTAGGLILAIFGFGFLVFIHELGHFIVAKKSGVRVEEFSVGMGPALFTRTKGETKYSVRLLPIGGYVAMEGENDSLEDLERGEVGEQSPVPNGCSFGEASIGSRALIMVAGATINLLFGLLLMGLITSSQISKDGMATNQVGSFVDGAMTNDYLQENDIIIKINGKSTNNVFALNYQLIRDSDQKIDLLVNRNGEELYFEQVPFHKNTLPTGVSYTARDFQYFYKPATFLGGIAYTWQRTTITVKQIWVSFLDLITGNVGVEELSGPVGITKEMTKQTSSGNWIQFFEFLAMLSLNLGVLNLLPLPALDGGRLLFLLFEKIRGKALNPKIEIAFNVIGMGLLLTLMLVVSFNDIRMLFT